MEDGPSGELIAGSHEKQFEFSLSDLDMLEAALISWGFQKVRYPNPFVLTVYFSTTDFRVPKSAYLRVRQYRESEFEDQIEITDAEPVLLETKGKDFSDRTKRRRPTTYSDVLALFASQFPDGSEEHALQQLLLSELGTTAFIPYVATQYERTHYIRNGVRITLDTDISGYGFFNGATYNAIRTSHDVLNGKLEVKFDDHDAAIESRLQDFEQQGRLVQIPPGETERRLRASYNAVNGLLSQ